MSSHHAQPALRQLRMKSILTKSLFSACVLLMLSVHARAQAPPQAQPWTLESARRHLQLYPDDRYAQFVALQLSRRAGPKEVRETVELLQRRDVFAFRGSGRREDIDLLNFTSGALAVQESLQLDTMTADMDGSLPDPRRRGGQDQVFNGSPEDRQRLQRIALAMLNYESAHGRLPTAASQDDNGKPLLSWRVHVLPFVSESALYDQFRLNEPWDSPHNQALISRMPDVFRASNVAGPDGTKTTYQVPTGKGTVFDGQRGVRIVQITDGTSNTLMLLQVDSDKAVEWTKPQDVQIDLEEPFDGILSGDTNWVDVATVDGSVRSVPKSVGAETFSKLLQRDDRQPVHWQAMYQNAPRRTVTREQPGIGVHQLQGPTIKSHPFQEMLAGRTPRTSQVSNWVPNDFYFVHSQSLAKLLSVAGDYETWSSELLRQAFAQGQQSSLAARLLGQLGFDPESQAVQQLDRAAVEVAVIGSDLYVNEGSDVTLLFLLESGAEVRQLLDRELAAAQQQHPKAEMSRGEYAGIAYTHMTTPDRSIHAISAYPRPDVLIRSNSMVAFKQVIDRFASSAGSQETKDRESLGETSEFRYVRTIFEYGADEEDVLVYLSDPFIRRLMGPTSKITELRRRRCYNHLQMLHYATLLYHTEHGTRPSSIEQLVRSECLPKGFLDGSIRCPDAGEYRLTTEGHTACCSDHGCARYMTPGCELATEQVTLEERRLYEAFLAEYNEYWRTYFDPIALRIRHAPETSRVETLILPLLDNSIYTAAAEVLGGDPISIAKAPVSERVVLSMGATFNKEEVIASESRPAGAAELNNLKQIALAVHNLASTHRRLPPATLEGSQLSWRVHILPYLEEQALYDRFRLDESWDSEHNKALLKEMPDVYGAEGTTTSILGFEEKGILNNRKQGLRFSQVTDGLSNTLLCVDAGPARAVPWTKPADLPFDPADPLASLGAIEADGVAAVFADGRAEILPADITAEQLLAYVTYNGREVIQRDPTPPQRPRLAIREQDVERMLRVLGISQDDIRQLDLSRFVQQGLGRHLSFHVYDDEPAFSFNTLRFAGQLMAARPGWLRSEMLFLVPLVNSLNAPGYVAWSLDDPSIVDKTLLELDGLLAAAARTDATAPVDLDFYRLANVNQPVWCVSWDVFGFRLRAFYARIGDHLVVASKPFVIDDLIQSTAISHDATHASLPGHVQVRIRPQHWSRIMNELQLTWGEAAREVCLTNLGPLNSAARLPLESVNDPKIAAQRAFGATYICPCGGTYQVHQNEANTTSVRCSLHGDAGNPRQATTVPDTSTAAIVASSLGDVNASLTFTEHGLQAVFEIQRQVADD